MIEPTAFGTGDASFQAAGMEAGIYQLVEDFYQAMDTRTYATQIRTMYPSDLTLAKDKLATFLIGWLGGPRNYQARFGSINIPSFHTKWNIASPEAHAWLGCMQEAIAKQPYSIAFKEYLLSQLKVPAERIKQACGNTQHLRA